MALFTQHEIKTLPELRVLGKKRIQEAVERRCHDLIVDLMRQPGVPLYPEVNGIPGNTMDHWMEWLIEERKRLLAKIKELQGKWKPRLKGGLKKKG